MTSNGTQQASGALSTHITNIVIVTVALMTVSGMIAPAIALGDVGTLSSHVSVDVANDTITVGDTTQASAFANNTTNVTTQATWTSSNTSVATIDSNGVVTAVNDGQTTINGSYDNDSDTVVVTVTDSDPDPLPMSFYGNVTIDGSPAPNGTTIEAEIDGEVRGNITVDTAGEYGGSGPQQEQLVVQGEPGDDGATVTFYVDNGSRLQANETATWSEGDTQELDLSAMSPTVTGIDLSLASSTVTLNDSTQATVTATYSDNSTANVTASATISSNNTSVATVNSAGVVSAVDVGQATLTASHQGENDTAVVTVVESNPSPLPASFYGTLQIDGSPASAGTTIEAEIGGDVRGSITTASTGSYGGPGPTDDQLVVNGTAGDDNATITFYVNNSNITRTQTFETANWSEGETTELNLTAQVGALDSISLDLANSTILENETTQATVTASYTNGSTINVTDAATITSADSTVATVSAGGIVTPNATGQTNLTATYQNETDNTTLTVVASDPGPLPESYYGTLMIDGSPAPAGTTVEAEINGTVRGSITTNSSGSYGGPNATDDQLVVNGTSGDDNATVTFFVNHSGINRTLADQNDFWNAGTTTELNLTANATTLDSISLTLANGTITENGSTQATVTATYSDNSTADVTASATISSNDTGVATVDGSGLVLGVSPGQTNILADFNGETDSAVITVVEDDPSPLPASFYGDLTIDGSPGAAGTTIEAEINGTVRGSITTNASGEYGGPGPTDDQLVVNGSSGDENATITFYVNGTGFNRTQAAETATWNAGDTTELNLTVSTVPGTLTGSVTNSSGTPLTGATVQVGATSDTTDGSGSYTLTLAPGNYTATASATGYQEHFGGRFDRSPIRRRHRISP
ncbi:MAG: Ig-like domain-containing protein [Natrialbaceae archaeon]|nr:Ig-like domain-containing protein [Natrialbaceae archaeon]